MDNVEEEKYTKSIMQLTLSIDDEFERKDIPMHMRLNSIINLLTHYFSISPYESEEIDEILFYSRKIILENKKNER